MRMSMIDHDPQWEKEFLEEARNIEQMLGKVCVHIFHIGSTAVPDLCAKPIIDMLLVVRDLKELDEAGSVLEEIGYEGMGEFGIPNRRYFRKGGAIRTHHIHAFQFDNVYEIERHVSFRDYVRMHEDVRKSYAKLKQKLAVAHPNDIEAYSSGKDAFVKRIEKEALLWHWHQR